MAEKVFLNLYSISTADATSSWGSAEENGSSVYTIFNNNKNLKTMTKVNFTKCKYCGEIQVNPDLECMVCGEINLTPVMQKVWDKAGIIKDMKSDVVSSYDPVKNSQYFSKGNCEYLKMKEGPTAIEKLMTGFKVGLLFENGQNSKFKIVEIDDTSVIFGKLTKDGLKIEHATKRRYSKKLLAQLITNKYFAITRIARREMFNELKAVGVFDLMKK